MSGYTKLFASILDSTVWQTSQATRLVWITMLAMADKDGVVEGSIPGLAKRAGVSLPEAEDALECFMSPDPYSRTKDYEGRRIEEVDGGWRLLNHRKHRDKLSKVEQNEKAAERMRARRSEKANNREQPRTTANTSEQFANVRDVRHADADTSPDAEERETRASAPPSEPAEETRPEPVSGVVATIPANDSRRSVSSAHVQEWTQTLSTVYENAKPRRAAPKATRDQTWQLAEHVRDLARVHGVTFADAAHKLAHAALASTREYPFSVLSLDPYAGANKPALPDYDEISRRNAELAKGVRV
jgi:hypothetical protein